MLTKTAKTDTAIVILNADLRSGQLTLLISDKDSLQNEKKFLLISLKINKTKDKQEKVEKQINLKATDLSEKQKNVISPRKNNNKAKKNLSLFKKLK